MASFVLVPGAGGMAWYGAAWCHSQAGETAGAWLGATGAAEAREQAAAHRGYATEFDVATYFLHDVPQDVLRTGRNSHARKPR